MKKAFISILGTNDYLECRHRFGDIVTDTPVKYCQQDIIKLFCKDFNEDSEIRIFLTEEAEKKNWLDNGHIDRNTKHPIPNKGLKSRLEEINPTGKIKSIPIKEGYNENEIWEIFQTIYDSFREEEEVLVDITHSFRSLPMLMITLLNFAKQIKKIKVNGIYYAAFESLGTINDVRNIPAQERVAPILDLTSFSELQDWTSATFDFVNNGSIKNLKKIVKPTIKKESKEIRNKISEVLNEIDKVLDFMVFCRGNSIKELNFNKIKQNILSLKSMEGLLIPFKTLIDELHEKFRDFQNSSILNVLNSVKWCFEHNFYQQAITLLLETIVTVILIKLKLDENNRDYRLIVSSSFTIKKNNISKDKWIGACKKFPKITDLVLNLEFLDFIKSDFDYLYEIRNDINHSGFSNDSFIPDAIKSRLGNSIDNILPKLRNFIVG